jgi:hypothetical protein
LQHEVASRFKKTYQKKNTIAKNAMAGGSLKDITSSRLKESRSTLSNWRLPHIAMSAYQRFNALQQAAVQKPAFKPKKRDFCCIGACGSACSSAQFFDTFAAQGARHVPKLPLHALLSQIRVCCACIPCL